MKKIIEAGPFNGIAIPADATRANADGDGVWWHPRDRTPLVLDRYPIDQGWKINISRHPGEIELPLRDPYSRQLYVDANGTVLRFPTVYITATLSDSKNDVVAEGTTLTVIDGVRAYEAGENNARNRLYEALGLVGAHEIDDFNTSETAKSSNVVGMKAERTGSVNEPAPSKSSSPQEPATTSGSPMDQVRAVPSTNRHARRSVVPPCPTPPVAATPAPAAVSEQAPAEQPDCLSPSLLALAYQRATMHGKPVPTFVDDDAIQAFLDDIAA